VYRNADLLQSQRFIWQFDDLPFRLENIDGGPQKQEIGPPSTCLAPFEIKDLSRDATEATQAQNKRDIETSTPSAIMKYLKTHRFLWNVAPKIWIDRARWCMSSVVVVLACHHWNRVQVFFSFNIWYFRICFFFFLVCVCMCVRGGIVLSTPPLSHTCKTYRVSNVVHCCRHAMPTFHPSRLIPPPLPYLIFLFDFLSLVEKSTWPSSTRLSTQVTGSERKCQQREVFFIAARFFAVDVW